MELVPETLVTQPVVLMLTLVRKLMYNTPLGRLMRSMLRIVAALELNGN